MIDVEQIAKYAPETISPSSTWHPVGIMGWPSQLKIGCEINDWTAHIAFYRILVGATIDRTITWIREPTQFHSDRFMSVRADSGIASAPIMVNAQTCTIRVGRVGQRAFHFPHMESLVRAIRDSLPTKLVNETKVANQPEASVIDIDQLTKYYRDVDTFAAREWTPTAGMSWKEQLKLGEQMDVNRPLMAYYLILVGLTKDGLLDSFRRFVVYRNGITVGFNTHTHKLTIGNSVYYVPHGDSLTQAVLNAPTTKLNSRYTPEENV